MSRCIWPRSIQVLNRSDHCASKSCKVLQDRCVWITGRHKYRVILKQHAQKSGCYNPLSLAQNAFPISRFVREKTISPLRQVRITSRKADLGSSISAPLALPCDEPVLDAFVRIDAPVFPLSGEGRKLHLPLAPPSSCVVELPNAHGLT
jgi:hypothetical protein